MFWKPAPRTASGAAPHRRARHPVGGLRELRRVTGERSYDLRVGPAAVPTETAARPPGRSTRRNSDRPRAGSGKNIRPRLQRTTSKLPSGKERACPSSTAIEQFPYRPRRSCALASIAGDRSAAVTCPVGPTILRAAPATSPVPGQCPGRACPVRVERREPAQERSAPTRGSRSSVVAVRRLVTVRQLFRHCTRHFHAWQGSTLLSTQSSSISTVIFRVVILPLA